MTIIEQARQLRTGGQAVDFRGPSLVVLEKMGLLAGCKRVLRAWGRSCSSTAGAKKSVGYPPKSSAASWRFTGATFARILYEAVRDDVNYRFGVRVTALDDDGQRVDVTFSDASTGSYDLVIGADGLHSGTRRLVFGPEDQYVTQLGQCFGFFDIENSLRLDHCGMACIDAGRTAALQGIDPDKPARASFFLTDPHLAFDYRDTEGNKRLFAERYAGMGWEVPQLARRPRRDSGGLLRFDRPSPPGLILRADGSA